MVHAGKQIQLKHVPNSLKCFEVDEILNAVQRLLHKKRSCYFIPKSRFIQLGKQRCCILQSKLLFELLSKLLAVVIGREEGAIFVKIGARFFELQVLKVIF